MNSDWHHLLEFIRRQEHRGEALALATLIQSDGSSYRQPGARLLINSRGEYAGSLSGGCLEEGVSKVAKQVLADGRIRKELINTEPHFGCPGTLVILIEKLDPNQGLLTEIEERVIKRLPLTVYTSDNGSTLDSSLGGDGQLCEVVHLRPRLIVIGWTADQEPLFEFAQTLHWDCHRVFKDTQMLAATAQVAKESLHACDLSQLAEIFLPDAATAVLIMSHHTASDLMALKSVANRGYPYIGLLGSKRRRERLLNGLGELGMLEDPSWLDSFYAPTGLDIGADHPATIALSIVAEIQAVLTKSTGCMLTEKVERIHQTSFLK